MQHDHLQQPNIVVLSQWEVTLQTGHVIKLIKVAFEANIYFCGSGIKLSDPSINSVAQETKSPVLRKDLLQLSDVLSCIGQIGH